MFSVAPIINGCSQESIFTGSLKDCKAFVREKLSVNPKSDFIITEDYE